MTLNPMHHSNHDCQMLKSIYMHRHSCQQNWFSFGISNFFFPFSYSKLQHKKKKKKKKRSPPSPPPLLLGEITLTPVNPTCKFKFLSLKKEKNKNRTIEHLSNSGTCQQSTPQLGHLGATCEAFNFTIQRQSTSTDCVCLT